MEKQSVVVTSIRYTGYVGVPIVEVKILLMILSPNGKTSLIFFLSQILQCDEFYLQNKYFGMNQTRLLLNFDLDCGVFRVLFLQKLKC
jgi:hypothetical protein